MRWLCSSDEDRLVCDGDEVLAEGNSIPVAGLPAQWRDAFLNACGRGGERLGAGLLGVAEEAMLIEGSAADWERWAGLAFPADGDYVVPGALVPVEVRVGRGVYREPCVWLRHVT